MACGDILDSLRYATEDLDSHIYRSASYQSIWLNLIQRGTYPLGVGTERTVFQIGNVEPKAAPAAWTAISLGSSNALEVAPCAPNFSAVEWGFHEMHYGPEMKQLKGPKVCRKDLLFSHDPDGFIRGYVEEITKRAKREWELLYTYHHRRLSKKAICVTDFEAAWYDQEDLGGTNAMVCPTCELTQEMLEMVAMRLMEDGATNPDSNGFISWQDSGPIFSLHIGMAQSQRILRQNDDLREDYRFADPNSLIARIGASRVIGNFRHVINQRPARYTCNAGVFTEVPAYVDEVAGNVTKGSFQRINPAWRTAPYEGCDVLSPDLFISEVVPPKNSAGGVSFNPVSYMGDWQFVTGAYKFGGADTHDCIDPLEDQGQHFAEMIQAAKPMPTARFKNGWHIIFKRCVGNKVECTTCSS